MSTKFQIREKVLIINNQIEEKYVGRIGRISKVYDIYGDSEESLYRVNVGGRLLKGVARSCDLQKIDKRNVQKN